MFGALIFKPHNCDLGIEAFVVKLSTILTFLNGALKSSATMNSYSHHNCNCDPSLIHLLDVKSSTPLSLSSTGLLIIRNNHDIVILMGFVIFHSLATKL